MGDIQSVILLDVDGVINEAQQPVTPDMQIWLSRLAHHYQVYFVTGNTYVKTVDILNGPIKHFMGVFCNNADELRTMRGKLVWQDTETPSLPDIQHQIQTYLGYIPNNAIEWRTPRFVNVSKIGRFASKETRDGHDGSWRKGMVDWLSMWSEIECSIGGKVSVDIYSKGADKARAAKYINDEGSKFIFIGDKTEEGGNDYPVKMHCEKNPENKCWTTKGPSHTIEMIEKLLR